MHAKHADSSELNRLLGRVIGCAFIILNALGAGLLEKVYENALAYGVRAAGHLTGGSDAMHQLSESDRSATLPAAEFQQAAPGDQTRCPWSINRADSSACFACIAFLHLR
ncbi:MAG TPA: GxxExxY protein [Acetobacteraceae bacterium]|jgi:predicted outer membrane lipoprotein|nr:GxxExxY protein [Acetobacteraceae bacterium]